ncbi:F-box/kelch-repeat protein At3g06240-like [Papaver somniferum]|uniref:F-box/kelch-repeat protein At3g06240-like n=1 Tax=Papaver somniferum TaxID=3469 RepID=UPI000E6FA36A|nr:F-box/kelch-repeat protein At3g06240-like [Papaver somniferum]
MVNIPWDFLDKRCEVQVYTLRSNSWRRLEDIQIVICGYIRIPDMARLPVNGGLHWKAFSGDRRTEIILRFDFENQEFDQLPIPDVGNHDNNQGCLCVLGGSLWFLNKYGCNLEFWEWKDNGVKKSWIHPFTFDMDKFNDMDDLTPLWLLDNGKFLFGVHDADASLRFVLYDPVHETTRNLKTCQGISASSFPTSVYVESLISIDTGSYLGKVGGGRRQ